MDINIKAKIELIFKIKSKLSLTPTQYLFKLLILFILFPLNSRHEKNPSVYKGLRGAFY